MERLRRFIVNGVITELKDVKKGDIFTIEGGEVEGDTDTYIATSNPYPNGSGVLTINHQKYTQTPKTVAGTIFDDGHTLIKLANGETWRVPDEVASYIFDLEMSDENKLNTIETLAQTVADFSAAMVPFSGLTMIALVNQARTAGKLIGKEIKPTEEAFNFTCNMVTNIRRPLEKELDKVREEVAKLKEDNEKLKKEVDELWIEKTIHKSMLNPTDIKTAKIRFDEIMSYNQEHIYQCILNFANKYNYHDAIYVERDGLQYLATTFRPETIEPPMWPEGKFAYARTPEKALEALAQLMKLKEVKHENK